MTSKSIPISAVGVLLISFLSISRADIYPGDGGFQAICQEIIDDVAANSIPFRQLGSNGQLYVQETLTRAALCRRLTAQHNAKNSFYLGGAIVSTAECVAALTAPTPYGISDWNNWAGRHCGVWKSTDQSGSVTQTFTDHALWMNAAVTSSGFYRQNVIFVSRTQSCCVNGWNEAGGTEDVVWGWDPKDPSNHYGYQGSHVGYSFTSNTDADCIVWLTGEEAFLECVRNVGSLKRRSSAGFWGFGQWRVQTQNTYFCEASRSRPPLTNRLLRPISSNNDEEQ